MESSESTLDRAGVQAVIRRCNCSEKRAVKILGMKGGDVDKAIRHILKTQERKPTTPASSLLSSSTNPDDTMTLPFRQFESSSTFGWTSPISQLGCSQSATPESRPRVVRYSASSLSLANGNGSGMGERSPLHAPVRNHGGSSTPAGSDSPRTPAPLIPAQLPAPSTIPAGSLPQTPSDATPDGRKQSTSSSMHTSARQEAAPSSMQPEDIHEQSKKREDSATRKDERVIVEEAARSRLSGVGQPAVGPGVDHSVRADFGTLEPEPEVEPESGARGPQEWDFVMPQIDVTGDLNSALLSEEVPDFSTTLLAGALQRGDNVVTVQHYLAAFDEGVVRRRLNSDLVEGVPLMFYAVATNDVDIVRLLAGAGGDVSAVHGSSGVPLLAFAIVLADSLEDDTTLLAATLLSLGAGPLCIPAEFYTPCIRDLPEGGPEDPDAAACDDATADARTAWCKPPATRTRLARTANLTQRYFLSRAAQTKPASFRQRQVARLRRADGILGVPYFLIGQRIAAKRLLQRLTSYLALPGGKRPLVLVFAGPSGHGKTELARKLGSLLSLELEVVDCTIVSREMELFGPREPYVGSAKGSPLNNFIARNAGRRSIVFLDEFEKTSPEIHQSLLLPFDNGEYQDRRNRSKVDCSNTIWILATNALDATIQKFCTAHEEIFTPAGIEDQALTKGLAKQLRDAFLARFGPPVTGRVSEFIPFLPFSPEEQAVVVHKFLLELGSKVRAPVQLSASSAAAIASVDLRGPGSWPAPVQPRLSAAASGTSEADERLVGGVRLRARRDGAVCGHLAAEGYSADLGARSLINAVRHVEDLLLDAYLADEEPIAEGRGLRDFAVDVKGGELAVTLGKAAGGNGDGE